MPQSGGQDFGASWSGQGVGTSRDTFLARIRYRLSGEPEDEAAEAVLCTLAQRLSGGVVREIQEELPEDIRGMLSPCVAHKGEEARPFDKDEFYLAVAEHLKLEPTDVRRVLHAVFEGLHSQITEATAEKVAAQLPDTLASTFVAARRGVTAPH